MTAGPSAGTPDEGLGFFDRLEDVIYGTLPELFPFKPVVARDRIVYRKHWFVLVRKSWLPILIVAAMSFAIFSTILPIFGGRIASMAFPAQLALVALALSPVLWLVWRYENWRNDYYVIASDRLIDVDKLPFGFRSSVKEAPIASVQNISMTMPNPLAATLDFGDVIIETAGREGALTFENVHHPRDVMEQLSTRVDAYHQSRKHIEREQRQSEMVDWFKTYEEVSSVSIVRNPPNTAVGREIEVEWRIDSGRQVETYLRWHGVDGGMADADNATGVQRGGPGNYRGVVPAALAEKVVIQAVAIVDENERRSPELIVPVLDFVIEFPATVQVGVPVEISWRCELALAGPAVLICEDEDFVGLSETAPARGDGVWYRITCVMDRERPIYFRCVGEHDGRQLVSMVHRIDPA